MRIILHLSDHQLEAGYILAARAGVIAVRRNKFVEMHGRKIDFVSFEDGSEFSVEQNKTSYTVRGE